MTLRLRPSLAFSALVFTLSLPVERGYGQQTAATPTLDSEQTAFLTLINNFRAQNGAPALQKFLLLCRTRPSG